MRYSFLPLVAAMALSVGPASGDAADVVAKRRAMADEGNSQWAVPRSNEPSGELVVLRSWPEPIDERIAIAALQGMVNRQKPVLYLGMDKPLRWLEYYGGKTYLTIEPDIHKVYDRYKDHVKGLVVYDFSLDALANVAITYAGIEDLIPATPGLADMLSSKFGWKVVHDLRGRWKTRIEAYTWAYENLLPRCGKLALTHYNHGYYVKDDTDTFGPNSETLKTGFDVDYAVEFRTFTWHVPTEPTREEKELAERVFESVPFHTPIFGRSSTQDTFPEPAFVSWVAQFGNLHIPAGMSNTSVLSGARIPDEMMRQKPLPVRDHGADKVYVAFTNSEHDNLEHVIGGGPQWHRTGFETDDPYRIWWFDPMRGKVPVGWPIGPLVADLAPTTMAAYNTTATENDYFLCALSGLCLSDPTNYGAAYPEIQEELLDDYCKLTGRYMKRLGWTQVQPSAWPGILRYFVKNIPELTGMMEGYGPQKWQTLEKANYILDGVPVFHAMTEGTCGTSRTKPIGEENARKAKYLADEISGIKVTERPAFIHAWTVGWDFGPTTLKMAADLLPADYVVVRPDELASLFKKYRADRALKETGPKTRPSGSVTETPNGKDGLIVDTGRIAVEIGWGSTPQPPLKRVRGVDGKWRGEGRLLQHNPRGMVVESATYRLVKDTPGEKKYEMSYRFAGAGSVRFAVTATAGCPYVMVEESSSGVELPSWAFAVHAAFQPDTLHTDAGSRPLDYKESRSLGSLPWCHWLLACKEKGPERDLIGLFPVSIIDWTGSTVLTWQRTNPDLFWEFYRARGGKTRYALAALDRNDPDTPARLWRELNGQP